MNSVSKKNIHILYSKIGKMNRSSQNKKSLVNGNILNFFTKSSELKRKNDQIDDPSSISKIKLDHKENNPIITSSSSNIVNLDTKNDDIYIDVKELLHPSWYDLLKDEFEKQYFKKLQTFLRKEEK